MPLVVEDGTSRSDAESYVSVEFCDAYHASLGNTDWPGVGGDLAAKEAALRKATGYLDARFGARFAGRRATIGQALEWPRAAAYDRDGYVLPAVPAQVKKAVCEAALRVVLGVELLPDGTQPGQVLSESVGPVSVTYADTSAMRRTGSGFDAIDYLLAPCLAGGSEGGGTIRMARA